MDYVALITYVFVMTATPGPNNIMVTTSGANFGYRATVPHMAGVVTGSTLALAAGCLGLGAIFTKIPVLHVVLSWVGLAYMLYLAWKLLGVKAGKEKQLGKPLTFVEAMLFQAINAKAWVIILTVASVFMPKTGEVIVPTLIIMVISALSCIISINFWTAFGAAMRRFLKTRRNQLIFNSIMAALLVVTAIMIVA